VFRRGRFVLISLIICTRNRCLSLRSCLEHIQRLESPGEWELVVVDNGSNDGTAELLRGFAEKVSLRLVRVSESKPGLASARNAGVAQASGEIIAFTDDDCYVASDFLIRMCEVFQDERIGFMGGRILLYDDADAPLTIRPEKHQYLIEPHTFIRPGQLHGANMAARRSLLLELGGFDPEFGVGSRFHACEETDFQARASQKGAMGIYDPRPLLWHHHGRKFGKGYNKVMKGYDYARGAYYAKFILNSQTRTLFLKSWYWLMVYEFHEQKFLAIVRELLGAFHYALTRFFKPMHNDGR
jgi:glycosyltransferase involved in cell wall biosynthesis